MAHPLALYTPAVEASVIPCASCGEVIARPTIPVLTARAGTVCTACVTAQDGPSVALEPGRGWVLTGDWFHGPCACCQRELIVHDSRLIQHGRRRIALCSRSCRRRWRADPSPRVGRRCQACQRELRPSARSDARFCSTRCRVASHRAS